MLSDDDLCGVQAEACSIPDSLGGEEGIKDIGFDLGRNSRTVIANFNDDRVVLAEGADTEFALALQGVYGVFDEVGPDLIQFGAYRT